MEHQHLAWGVAGQQPFALYPEKISLLPVFLADANGQPIVGVYIDLSIDFPDSIDEVQSPGAN